MKHDAGLNLLLRDVRGKSTWYVSFTLKEAVNNSLNAKGNKINPFGRVQKSLGLDHTANRKTAMKEALSVRDKVIESYRGNRPGKADEKVTVKEVMESYRRYLKANGKPDIKSYFERLTDDDATTFSFGSSYLARDVCQSDIDSLVLARLEGRFSAATICYEVAVLRAAMNRAGVAFIKLRRNTLPRPNEKTRALTLIEYDNFLRYMSQYCVKEVRADVTIKARQSLRDMVIFSVWTGARFGELCSCRWRDIDFERRIVGLATLKKRGARPMRWIGMSDELYEMLNRRRSECFKIDGIEESPLFPNCSTHDTETEFRTARSHALTRLIDKAGLNSNPVIVERDGRCTHHSFRHTFATFCLKAGMSLVEVSGLLGHANIKQTMRYLNLDHSATTARVGVALSAFANQRDQARQTG